MGRAFELADGRRIPIPCGRNSCPFCRRRNVVVTAAMLGLDASDGEPPSLALTTTTRDWVPDWALREITAQYARKVRAEVGPFEYCWLREWTTGEGPRSGGVRRTHKHWVTKGVPVEAKQLLVDVAVDIWGRRTGADRHHVMEVWNARGFGNYIAGLVGHHLKGSQAPPAGWQGRRVAASRGYYSTPASELRARAETVVRAERLHYRVERELADDLPDTFVDETTWDELVSGRVEARLEVGPPSVVPVAWDYWEREGGDLNATTP